ncbi:hypothetical protein M0813_18831 [Anaeramoeba flamelloides]|uniref:Uncharacterized protein n=1 Tax=Anaeramoeba flamelloides TaxID=1746091 RepID=A0ABQ8YRW2_9EUKA|nr:hypothetical protein M0813_18831 [Anaeramoeba flamelloides]
MGSFIPKWKPSTDLSGLFDSNEVDIYYHLAYHRQNSTREARSRIFDEQIKKKNDPIKQKHNMAKNQKKIITKSNKKKKKQINLTKNNFHKGNPYTSNNSTHHQKKDRVQKKALSVMSIVVDPKNKNLNEKKKAEINTEDLLRTIDNTLEEDENQNRFKIPKFNEEESIEETSQDNSIFKRTTPVLNSTEEEIDLMSGLDFTSENETENGSVIKKTKSNLDHKNKASDIEEHTKKSDSNLVFSPDSDSNSEKISSSKSQTPKAHPKYKSPFRYDPKKHQKVFTKSDHNKRYYSTQMHHHQQQQQQQQQQVENQKNDRATSFFNSDQQAWEDELDTDEEISFSNDNVERRQPIDYNEFISQEEESEMFGKEDLNENEVLEIFSD